MLRRSPSIQSVSSSVDSAGSILLGRHVLAPRRDHGNRLYLGVIKTQVSVASIAYPPFPQAPGFIILQFD